MDKVSYKDSGVNIDEGNALVKDLKKIVKSTFNKNVLTQLGSFAGAYELPKGYKNPVILGATDGVGTKLRLAIDSKKLSTIGIDLVAMSVNDLICNFAEPMFFLDYYATGKLNKKDALIVINGIAQGCKEAQCALIGGESAEMSGIYQNNDFDLAGFATGIAEKEDLEVNKVQNGDILIALPSSGIHSNGYSLVRKICFEILKMDYNSDFEGEKLIDVLLKPTKIYVSSFKLLKKKINALAHITGGGLIENLPRVFNQNLGAKIEKSSIKTQSIFKFLGKYVEEKELYRTFNMGVGMVLIVNKNNVDFVLQNSEGYIIGEVNNNNKIEIL